MNKVIIHHSRTGMYWYSADNQYEGKWEYTKNMEREITQWSLDNANKYRERYQWTNVEFIPVWDPADLMHEPMRRAIRV